MSRQNIFDDPYFFSSYQELRSGKNFNELLEQPAMRALLPDIRGKKVLDIGCGSGINCLEFSSQAQRVLGIDISTKMLMSAMKENSAPNIEYRLLDMEKLDEIDEAFDLIYSSLAFHYAVDFPRLIAQCFSHLNRGGILLFSQEHPITTCSVNTESRYVKDKEGNVFFKMADYQAEGERHIRWFVDDVIHQHRKLETIINTLTAAGFTIQSCTEPCPDRKAIRQLPRLANELIKPSFIIFKAVKGD